MVKCSICGKDLRLGIDAFCHGELVLCSDCNKKITKEELEKREIEEKNKKASDIKKDITRTELSLPELQLQEIMKMKKDVSTIKNIMLFYMILFIIFIIISLFKITI
ncbi:MAG: hypothetical protein MUO82_04165 [Candidatus Thermoplasmatota archaeon]|nr:hypothetical protein [Candidatus Thermoplasmatota archaeon]